ncbi:MarR family winged helix-turn-helix transcriptional regulator [Planotetraspora kaengkrachanensis]|uniref:MarR family transcriptional regulator n=1 Tax=Planotetraspora kaengkrachanensis TaxID=575193 RepID=A0A8J3VCI1_9ACTN|nr:MarR family transcriptional regulator [Planotetraspora kaengkrachanensis]GIG84808.1 MarR family transcriptional regulator [Planotetraspora kaengkrachanensis]
MDFSGDRDLPAIEITTALERLTRMFLRLAPRGELSLTAVSVLSLLERSGPRRLTDLAMGEGVTQPAMTQLVSRLQDAGLAVRAGDPDDGRVVLVHVTDAGRAALAERRAARAALLSELLSRLPEEELDALVTALPAIGSLTSLMPDERPAAGRTF